MKRVSYVLQIMTRNKIVAVFDFVPMKIDFG
jgi:hypothetical protein